MIKIRASTESGMFDISVDIEERDMGITDSKELTEEDKMNLCMILTSIIAEAKGNIESEELGEKFKELIKMHGSIVEANVAIQLSSNFTVEPMAQHTVH